MTEGKNHTRNTAGCDVNECQQKIHDELSPHDWNAIYQSFKDEMIMFHNVVYMVKRTPAE